MPHRRAVLPAACSAATTHTARAQAPWPSRPITIVAPLAAGSSLDMVARLVAEPATRERASRMAFDLVPQGPPEAMAMPHRAEFGRWGPILRAAGARVD